MGLRMKKFNILGVHWKIRFLEGVTKNQYRGGDYLKRGRLGQFVDLRGGIARKRWECFWGGGGVVDTPVHTMINNQLKSLYKEHHSQYNLENICTVPTMNRSWYRSSHPEMFLEKIVRKYAGNLPENTHAEVWFQ